tara:strand:+ start:631 stop:1740 length:1110 start_codon:yes stop_codon:yes gene_type:complete
MAIKYLAGERLIGTAAERAAMTTSASAIPQTSWKEIARTTLTGNGDTITVNSIPAKDNLMIIINVLSTSGSDQVYGLGTFNNDTSSNYASRWSSNGGSDTTEGSASSMRTYFAGSTTHGEFGIMNVRNIANQEKLCEIYGAGIDTDGAGTAPKRREIVCKWANTSNQITRFDYVNGGAADFAIGSEIIVLGCDDDEADSGTNFWQEIEKSPAYTSGTDLSSGTVHTNTFTAKKYLMVSVKTKSVGTNYANYKWRFNSDTGSNYAARYNDNGGSDGTSTSAANIMTRVGEVASSHALATAFIRNLSDKEKLGILHVVQGGASGAGTSLTRHEIVFKWADTSNQITSMGGVSSSGSGTNLGELEIRIWGAN